MIKVLYVVCNNVMHGTERYVVDLARNIDKNIFSVCVATPEKGPLSDILQFYNIEEIIYNNGRMNLFTLKGAVKLFKQMFKKKFDVIHTNAGVVPNLLGKILRVKLNIEIKHGILIPDEILNTLSFKQKYHEKIKQYLVDYFIAISENDKKKMIKFFNIKEKKIEIIYNGVDLQNLLQYKKENVQNNNKHNDEIIIGTIGRLEYQKGHDVLIKAFSRVVNLYPKIKLLILGTVKDEN